VSGDGPVPNLRRSSAGADRQPSRATVSRHSAELIPAAKRRQTTGAVAALGRARGDVGWRHENRRRLPRQQLIVPGEMSPEEREELWQEGQAMTQDEALAYALADQGTG
jgi:hypothetical protein